MTIIERIFLKLIVEHVCQATWYRQLSIGILARNLATLPNLKIDDAAIAISSALEFEAAHMGSIGVNRRYKHGKRWRYNND